MKPVAAILNYKELARLLTQWGCLGIPEVQAAPKECSQPEDDCRLDPLVDLYEGIDLFPAEDQIKEFSASPRPALPGAAEFLKISGKSPDFW